LKLIAIFFLLGVSSVYFFSQLPPLLPLAGMTVCALLACFLKTKWRPVFKISFIFLLGMSWVLYGSAKILAWTLPADSISVPTAIEGSIASIPIREGMSVSFIFHMSQFDGLKTNTDLKLSWYKTKYNRLPDLKVGDEWCFFVKLKPPHMLHNPGSFDSEKFSFSHGIRATGYIVDKMPVRHRADTPSLDFINPVLLKSAKLHHWIDRIREKLLGNMKVHLAGKPYASFIYALTIGEKFEISKTQWQIFQNTGTNHLMAIAGLHIGFLAGLIFLLVKLIWRCIPRLPLLLPSHQAAAIGSLVSALIYSSLAGFAIPTQRAVMMLSVFLLGLLYRRYITAWHSVALAMLGVLIWDPLSVLTVAFWLSFGAISLIAFGLSARFNMNTLWWKHGRIQWVVSVGLIPLTLLFFSNASLISPLANSIAIPLVGFVTVPLSLLGAFLSLVNPYLAHIVLSMAEWTLHPLWAILRFLSSISFFSWQHISQQPFFIFPALLGVLLLLAPSGLPNRFLGIFFILPLLFSTVAHPKSDEVWFTLLEVGQGLSAVVQTEHHVLVFDTGPKFSENYDMGQAVVLPFLRYHHLNKIDLMVVSHPDNDHIGGADSLRSVFPETKVVTSVPDRFPGRNTQTCLRGEHWNWDGVHFEFLYPEEKDLGQDNNSSCVLKVSLGSNQILLTGDIEKPAEKRLLEHPEELASTILVVPHHGSKTSSTEGFVDAVHPRIALFPVGYLNRFKFPKPLIIERYQERDVILYDTATGGAVSIRWHFQSAQAKVETFSKQSRHLWNH
jgi:competence protein ComEC